MQAIRRSKSLIYRCGKSDKFYNIQIVAGGPFFSVVSHYGRRGTTGVHICKDKTLNEDEANKIFDSIVASKIKKGYICVHSAEPTLDESKNSTPAIVSLDSFVCDEEVRKRALERLMQRN